MAWDFYSALFLCLKGLDMKQNIAKVLHDVTVKSIFNDDFKKYHNEGRAVQALGLRADPMRGIWNNASPKDRRFICRIINLTQEQFTHDDAPRVGVGAWGKDWDSLGEHSKVLIAECFMKLRGWVARLDAIREAGVHHG